MVKPHAVAMHIHIQVALAVGDYLTGMSCGAEYTLRSFSHQYHLLVASLMCCDVLAAAKAHIVVPLVGASTRIK